MTRDLQCRSRHSAPHRWLGAAILVLLLAAPPMARSAQAGALETANVMAPLDMRFDDQARNDFRRQLQTARPSASGRWRWRCGGVSSRRTAITSGIGPTTTLSSTMLKEPGFTSFQSCHSTNAAVMSVILAIFPYRRGSGFPYRRGSGANTRPNNPGAARSI